jgi:cardiolipin synthase
MAEPVKLAPKLEPKRAPQLLYRQERLLAQLGSAPNLLTILRLGIIPFLVIAILDGNFWTALVLLFLAGASDGLDGLLARLLHQRTLMGQYLDPIADKLMLSTLFIVLTHVGLVPLRVTVLVFSRDLGIVLIGSLIYLTSNVRDFRPSLLGKVNTLVQIFAVTIVMVCEVYHPLMLQETRRILLDSTMVLTVASAAHYAWLMSQRMGAAPAT